MAYSGKYPDQIKSVVSALRLNGERYAALLIETNGGAHFRLPVLHPAVNRVMPRPKQEIEHWLYHVEPMNVAADDAFFRYGVAP